MNEFAICNQIKFKYLKGLQWVDNVSEADVYTSRYAAKKRLKSLDNLPEGVNVVELICNNEKVNNGK